MEPVGTSSNWLPPDLACCYYYTPFIELRGMTENFHKTLIIKIIVLKINKQTHLLFFMHQICTGNTNLHWKTPHLNKNCKHLNTKFFSSIRPRGYVSSFLYTVVQWTLKWTQRPSNSSVQILVSFMLISSLSEEVTTHNFFFFAWTEDKTPGNDITVTIFLLPTPFFKHYIISIMETTKPSVHIATPSCFKPVQSCSI